LVVKDPLVNGSAFSCNGGGVADRPAVTPPEVQQHGSLATVQIQVTARHGHLSEESHDRIKAKTEKLLRHFDRLMSIEVVVDFQDPNKPRVDVLVSAEHKHDFVSHDQSMNLMTSVEAAVHKVDQQIRKYKDRIIENHRDPEVKRQAPEPAAAEDDAEN
jgi:putative sigma-54 modulation protein